MKKFLAVSAILGGMAFSTNSYADLSKDFTISYQLHTNHTAAEEYEDKDTGEKLPWNEDNGFVGLRWELGPRVGVGVAYGENSYFEKSFIVEADLREPIGRPMEGPLLGGQLELGANLFLATGYEQAISGGVLPGINPYLRYRTDWGGSIKMGTVNFATLNIIVEYSFDL